MTRRTRSWRFVGQEAMRLAKLGLTGAEIARRLGVNKSSVGRWIKDGKLEITAAPSGPVGERPRQTPAEWAADVRGAFDLDATDDQLVTLGEQALGISREPTVLPHVRMSAAGRFQAIVRQLKLARRGAEEKADAPREPEPPAPRRNPPVKRPSGDPRGFLSAVPK